MKKKIDKNFVTYKRIKMSQYQIKGKNYEFKCNKKNIVDAEKLHEINEKVQKKIVRIKKKQKSVLKKIVQKKQF